MMAQSQNAELIDKAEKFYRNYCSDQIAVLAQKYPKDQKSLHVDWRDLYRFDSDLADDVLSHPEQLTEMFEEALRLYDLPVPVDFADAHVRFENLPEEHTYQIGETRHDHLGDYLALSGQVTKRTAIRPKAVEAAFECQRCGTLTRIPQTDGEMEEPHECQGCERQGPFRLNTEQSQFVDHQMVRIRQPADQAQGAEGQSIDVVLEDDITGRLESGDRVTIQGKLKLDQKDTDDTAAFDTYLDGHAVEVEQTDFEEIDVSDYRDEIQEIADNDPIDTLTDSLAPKLRGMEDEKLAIVLQLFSGTKSYYPDGSVDRGDFHVLLLGDPGCGKSSLLRAVEKIAPRSTYASGKGASAAGMTGAAVRDDFGDTEWGIEAGALAVANKGVACVDEIDKVDDDAVQSLHNALESQTIEISKAGINASLQAETALLAAGNPKYGRFDQYEPMAEQIDLGPTLLSRFDLMFMLTDEPDPDEDDKIAKHMIESRRNANRYTHDDTVDESDLDRICLGIDRDVMRAYIAYAKQNVQPTITENLDERISDWYTTLRNANDQSDSPVPVTPRKLEALERLAEASARARLSDVVEKEDVERVAQLVLESMRQVGVDPDSGEFDADVVETGMSKSQRDRVKSVKSIVEELEAEYEAGAPHEDVLHRAMDVGIDKDKAEYEIDRLKEKGEMYEPRTDHYRTS